MRHSLTAILAAAGLTLAATGALAGDAKSGDISVTGAWSRATAAGAPNGAAFMTIDNRGKQADKVVAATSPVAKTVELHTHIMDGQVMRMRQVEAIEVPAGGQAILKPGGLHVMLMGLHEPLKQGSTFPVTLRFANAGDVTVEVDVQAAGAAGPMAGHDMGHGKMKH